MLIIPIYLVAILFISVFIGVYDVFDSFAYLNIGNYLLVDHWYSVSPWNASIPQTLYGPIYPILTVFFLRLSEPMRHIGIPLMQGIFLGIGAYAIAQTTSKLFSKFWQKFSVLIFFLLPFNLLYTTFLMSETLSICLMSIYIWIISLIVKTNKSILVGLLLLVQSFMILTKYAFQALIPVTIVFCIWHVYKLSKQHKYNLLISGLNILIGSLGIFAIFLWLAFNNKHYGSWQLTNMSGRHLYAGPVYRAKLLPPPHSQIYQEFVSKLGDKSLIFQPAYDIEWIFEKDFIQNSLNEIAIDRKFGTFALESIHANIPEYAMFVLKNFIFLPFSVPIATPMRIQEISTHIYNYDYAPYGPLIFNRNLLSIYFSLIDVSIAVYIPITILLIVLTFIGCLRAFKNKKWILLLIMGITLPLYILFSAVATNEGRYFMLFYSSYAILITYGVEGLVNFTITVFLNRQYTKNKTISNV